MPLVDKLLRLAVAGARRRHRIGFGGGRNAAIRNALAASGTCAASAVGGGSGSRRMRARIRRLRSLVFALGGRMIDVMVASIVTLGRERYRTKHNCRREEALNWS